jgi:predicted O-methyltransferase YrrM
MKELIKKMLLSLPYLKRMKAQNIELRRSLQTYNDLCCYPPGHYYSTIVDLYEIRKNEDRLWSVDKNFISGININSEKQLNNIKDFSQYFSEMPFYPEARTGLRYYFDNKFFNTLDGLTLYSMIREYKPKKIIEIGSGFSSAVMMDTNELFFTNEIEISFVEPFAERLKSLMNENDLAKYNLIEDKIQNISPEKFMQLGNNDILFIDSSHVVKTGSDVNYLLFKILPQLNKGVLIHFHDIFFPFEYPKEWIFQGRNWNENYFLHAFLMYNSSFEVELFNSYLFQNFPSELIQCFPVIGLEGGGSIWLRKIN